MKAAFIAIEGVDGAGKTTQQRLLAERLRRAGRDVLEVREPGGTALGERVREVLLSAPAVPMCVETETLLFLASRVQLYEEMIAPRLAAGGVVISDRYHLSTLVYQGIAREQGIQRVAELCGLVLANRRPHVNVVLDIPPDERRARRAPGDDRYESDPALIERVARGFAEVKGLPGDRIERVDGSGTPEEVSERVYRAVNDAL